MVSCPLQPPCMVRAGQEKRLEGGEGQVGKGPGCPDEEFGQYLVGNGEPLKVRAMKAPLALLAADSGCETQSKNYSKGDEAG